MVRYLLAHGADPMIRDRQWEDTPLNWTWGPRRAEAKAALREAVAAQGE